jgi:hypothetical protein
MNSILNIKFNFKNLPTLIVQRKLNIMKIPGIFKHSNSYNMKFEEEFEYA